MLENLQRIDESESEEEELPAEVEITPVYVSPRIEGAPEVVIPKGFKYQIPLPPVDVKVKEDGDLWGNTLNVKFIDYNLGDPKTYP